MKALTSSLTLAVFASLTVALALSVVPAQAQTPGAICEFDATGICAVDSPIFDSGGNIGIGTRTPARILHTSPTEIHAGGFAGGFSFGDRGSNDFVEIPTNGERWVWYSLEHKARLWSGQDILTVTPRGDVGIGTLFPGSRLYVVAEDDTNSAIHAVSAGGTPLNPGLTVDGSALTIGYLCVAFANFTADFPFGCNNFVTASYSLRLGFNASRNGKGISAGWETYSSRRFKTNIQTIHGALEKVERLRGVSFNWNEGGKHGIGLIAEEVGQVVPEVVTYEENGKDAIGLDYARLTALLIEAVRDQQVQIRELKAETEGLKTLGEQAVELKEKETEIADLKTRLEALERLVKQTQTASR